MFLDLEDLHARQRRGGDLGVVSHVICKRLSRSSHTPATSLGVSRAWFEGPSSTRGWMEPRLVS